MRGECRMTEGILAIALFKVATTFDGEGKKEAERDSA
jgi:hypothetical protein